MLLQNDTSCTAFKHMHSSEKDGAEGQLVAAVQVVKTCGDERLVEKLIGITTDGEAANTGKNAGFKNGMLFSMLVSVIHTFG
jgi:hypothetical protein